MESKIPFEADSDKLPPPPKWRVINYQVTNKELGDAIQKALHNEGVASAGVFVGESPGREGWAIHALVVQAGHPERQIKLVMYPSGTNGTNLVTQRHRVMTWARLEVLLGQVQKWLGGNARVSLMFNWLEWLKFEGMDE